MTPEELKKAIEAPFERFAASETRRFDELMAIFDRIEARLRAGSDRSH
jgi:hypothetical protein